ncbi:MAG: hypothetical protein KAW00_01105 [Dehalococcoidia bacterium]|nr:hypothetical protein [Dehalococcoidia bacterium]
MVDIVDPDRWWYQMVVELMERLHPANFGELPDGVRDDVLAIWRSERDRVVKELEAMLLGHMRDEIVVDLIKRLRER